MYRGQSQASSVLRAVTKVEVWPMSREREYLVGRKLAASRAARTSFKSPHPTEKYNAPRLLLQHRYFLRNSPG
jgi:hypothetical protein